MPGEDFPDDTNWSKYVSRGGNLTRPGWRRMNINRFVQRIYNLTRTKSVAFSVSPFGLYRPGSSSGMPSPIAGFDPYSEQYADAKLWLQMGWVDYLMPQLYWQVEPPSQSYRTLLDWWLTNNPLGRHIVAGSALYKLSAWPVTEIEAQVEISRDWFDRNSTGNVFFSARALRHNVENISSVLRAHTYVHPALVPCTPSLRVSAVASPAAAWSTRGRIHWKENASMSTNNVRFWAVYRAANLTWNLVEVVDVTTTWTAVSPGVYAVRAVNKAGYESPPRTIANFHGGRSISLRKSTHVESNTSGGSA